ncbi:MAG: RNA polymerase sigma-70 factor [Bacteroidota bacterium]|nr:RNA polymerase sigma-70 factor [Bacteroidota bacterium]MDP4205589.1 RNA polymerase sigma-70 factor [Bacteroidota bacterium]
MNFDTIFKKYHHRLLLYSLKFIEQESDALDLVQDVFLSLWEKDMYFDNDETLRAYLFSAMRNKCLDFLKHQKVVSRFESQALISFREMEISHYQNSERSMIERENLLTITTAIDSLSDINKEIILLSRFEGLKNKEIAERLQIPIRTVETRLFRALATLKERIPKNMLHLLLFFYRSSSSSLFFKKNKSC